MVLPSWCVCVIFFSFLFLFSKSFTGMGRSLTCGRQPGVTSVRVREDGLAVGCPVSFSMRVPTAPWHCLRRAARRVRASAASSSGPRRGGDLWLPSPLPPSLLPLKSDGQRDATWRCVLCDVCML